ncbi:MAG: DUF4147 domain-containing protein [Thiotrichaceae bacterium]|nr:DUF4147 domain-containing protein [Thiotrichaceae bacterium]PCI14089.1 MAG: hydroxypyruvate reductase [Thiotrichales bacterium]
MSQAHRKNLLAIYQAAIDGVNGRVTVRRYLASRSFKTRTPYYLIGIGKAAASMAQGAFDVMGDQIEHALIITRHGYGGVFNNVSQPNSVELIEAGHPQPDQHSLMAGQRLLSRLDEAAVNAEFIFLISGGTSALVELLPESIDLIELQRINRWLLGSGLAIDDINQIRRALSLIKGGRLIPYLKGRMTLNLLMSDVPNDEPAIIGSGLLIEQSAHCPQTTIEKTPGWMRQYLDENISGSSESVSRIETTIIASASDARKAAAMAAEELGYRVYCHPRFIDGDAILAGQQLIAELNGAEAGIHIWSGETTVQLPDEPGQGGRCQHLALAAAEAMQPDSPIILLAAGTDGSDGGINQIEADAGALVDAATIRRGELEGFDLSSSLLQADAGAFLAASGDLVSTGATGANVMDLMIAYISENITPYSIELREINVRLLMKEKKLAAPVRDES